MQIQDTALVQPQPAGTCHTIESTYAQLCRQDYNCEIDQAANPGTMQLPVPQHCLRINLKSGLISSASTLLTIVYSVSFKSRFQVLVTRRVGPLLKI